MADEGSTLKKRQDHDNGSLKEHQYTSKQADLSAEEWSERRGAGSEQEDDEGAIRPGHGIYNRRRERRQRSILGVLDRKLTGFQKEVLHYCTFVALFSIGWFLDRPGEDAFFLSQRVKERFLSKATNSTHLTWHEATAVDDVWNWMAGPLLNVVYDEDTPGSGVGNILGVNGLLYGLRVRQVRVRGLKCSESPSWAYAQITQKDGFNGECYPAMTSWNQNKAAFGVSTEGDVTVEPLFSWTEAESWSQSTSTDYGYYPADGFMLDLPAFNKSKAVDLISFHRRHHWLDVQTRAVFIDAMLFNPSLRLAASVRLLAEMPEFGGVDTSSSFFAVRLLRYTGVSGVLELIIDLLCIIWTLKLLFVEFLAARALRVEYIKSFWGILMWIKGILIFAVVGLRVTAIKEIGRQHAFNRDLQDASTTYVDLHHIPSLALIDANIMAVLAVLIYTRLFSYCAKVPGVEHLSRVIVKALAEIVPFFLLFCIIFLGFSLAFYSLFGLQVHAYRSFASTLSSNCLVLMGSSEYYEEMALANPTMAPLLYYSLLVVEYVLLLNMFTAIMVHSVTVVKSELAKEPDQLFMEKMQMAIDLLKKRTSPEVHDAGEDDEADSRKHSFDEGDPLVQASHDRHGGGGAAGVDPSHTGAPRPHSRGEHANTARKASPSHPGGHAAGGGGGGGGEFGRLASGGGGGHGGHHQTHHAHHHSPPERRGHGHGGGGHGGLTEVQGKELLGQVEEMRQRLVVVDDLRTQVLSVSDRLNALTEYLLSEPLNRGEERFAAVSRKLDRLCEALVATNLEGEGRSVDALSASLGIGAEDSDTVTLAGGRGQRDSRGAAGSGIPGWTD